MNNILSRRRGMMGKTKEPNHLVYSLYNQTVEAGSNRISTGVKPLASDFNLTILLDITISSNPTSGVSRLWKLIHTWNDALNGRGLVIGKYQASNTTLSVWWNNPTNTGITGSSVSTGRHRIAVTHEAGSDDLKLYYKKDNGTLKTQTVTQTFTASPNSVTYLGAGNNDDNSLPPGTINKAEIYDVILDSVAINTFFA